MDYNWLFSATAQCSAAIVAILGGFIASRLLSINSERRELSIKISDVDDEIIHKEKRIKELEEWLLEEDSEDFIRSKFDELVAEKSIENVYTVAESYERDIDKYRKYWDDALVVVQKAKNYFNNNALKEEFKDIARIQLNNMYDLTYDIWEKVYKLEKKKREKSNYGFEPLYAELDFEPFIQTTSYSNVMNYRENNRELGAVEANVEWLKKQKESYSQRKKALTKPKGMVEGIIVFILFSILGIIIPMSLMPHAESQHSVFLKWVDIVLFIVGIGSVIWYLIWFLRSDSK